MSDDIVLDCRCEPECGARLFLEASDDGEIMLTIGDDQFSDVERRSISVLSKDIVEAIERMRNE